MITLLLHLFRLLPILYGSHRHLALENLALRHQLTVYKRTVSRPTLRPSDRLFWVALSRGVGRVESGPHRRGPPYPIERPEAGRVVPIREVGGLHHRYVRRAA